MPDDNTTADPALAAPPAVTPPGQAPTDTTPTLPAGEGKTLADYERMVAELRKENAGHRTKLNKFEADEKARADAQLSEQQKLEKRAADLEARNKHYQQQLINSQVQLAAQRRGIIDPELAALAIQQTLEYGDDGMPTNLDKALDELVKARPFLIAQQQQGVPARQTGGNATNPARSQTNNVGAITRDNLAEHMANYSNLTPSQREEVTRLLTNRR